MNYKIINKKQVYNGFFAMDKLYLQIDLFGGGKSKIFTREIFKRGDACALLPFDVKNNLVLMVQQFRPGACEHNINPWLIEPIAGVIEKNEKTTDVVKREAQEEAGLNINMNDLIHIGKYLVSPGGSTEAVTLYAININLIHIKENIHGLECENEDIKVKIIDIDIALQNLQTDNINNALAMISLLWLARRLKK
jgi:ADP-ribose pyrophosphatase